MKRYTSIEDYFLDQEKGRELILALRNVLLDSELTETLKWSIPCYTLINKNVIGMACFKNHVAIWFYNGVFLEDKAQVLRNAQEGKTKGLRQWTFNFDDTLDIDLIKAYIQEAIENQKLGKIVKPTKTKEVKISPEIEQVFNVDPDFEKGFKALSLSKQKDYIEHIDSAKRQTTKESRLTKIIPMIIRGEGLNDKYKK